MRGEALLNRARPHPEHLDDYDLLAELGRGGTGVVYRARRQGEQGEVALKLLPRALDAQDAQRQARELRLAAELGADDGFVPLLRRGQAGDRTYLVMPLLRGGTLRDRLRGRLHVEEVLRQGRALARALEAAHARGVVHRDVKPENVLLDDGGRPFLADLGLAKGGGPEAGEPLSRTGEFRGTMGYAAPEQLVDARDVTPAADVFALGAILFEALAGQPAFPSESLLAYKGRVDAGIDPGTLARLRPDAPAWLVRVVERCLAPDPTRRFAGGAALAAALAGERAEARPAANPALFALLIVLGGAALAGGVLLLRADPPGGESVAASPSPDADLPSLPAWLAIDPAEEPRPQLRRRALRAIWEQLEASDGEDAEATSVRIALLTDQPLGARPASRLARGYWALGALRELGGLDPIELGDEPDDVAPLLRSIAHADQTAWGPAHKAFAELSDDAPPIHWLWRGWLRARLYDPAGSEADARRAKEAGGDPAMASYVLADAGSSRGIDHVAAGIQRWMDCQRLAPHWVEPWRRCAEYRLSLADVDGARRDLDEAERRSDGPRSSTQRSRARLAASTNRPAEAWALACSALELAERADLPDASDLLVSLARRLDRLPDGLPEFERARERHPNDATLTYHHGLLLAATGRLDEALGFAARLPEEDPGGPMLRTKVALERGWPWTVVTELSRGLERHPHYAWFLAARASAYWNLQLPALALLDLRTLADQDTLATTNARLLRGRIRLALGNQSGGFRDLEYAGNLRLLTPADAKRFEELRDTREAGPEKVNRVNVDALDAAGWLRLAYTRDLLDGSPDAEDVFREALARDLDPKSALFLRAKRGVFRLGREQFAEAEAAFVEATRDHWTPFLVLRRVECRLLVGDVTGARALIAALPQPVARTALGRYADALVALWEGRYPAAQASLRACARVNRDQTLDAILEALLRDELLR
jgi:tetratricopeptide (TPR) repeat protein